MARRRAPLGAGRARRLPRSPVDRPGSGARGTDDAEHPARRRLAAAGAPPAPARRRREDVEPAAAHQLRASDGGARGRPRREATAAGIAETAGMQAALTALVTPERFPDLSRIVAGGGYTGAPVPGVADDFTFGLERILDGIEYHVGNADAPLADTPVAAPSARHSRDPARQGRARGGEGAARDRGEGARGEEARARGDQAGAGAQRRPGRCQGADSWGRTAVRSPGTGRRRRRAIDLLSTFRIYGAGGLAARAPRRRILVDRTRVHPNLELP